MAGLPSPAVITEARDTRPMHRYRVFGRVLHSDLEFPELPPAGDGPGDWTLRALPPLPALPGSCRLLGQDDVNPTITVRLYASPTGLWLNFDDTGCFEIATGGSDIRWHAPPDEVAHLARLDVLGRVLAVALHMQGFLCLHGSGVCIGSQAIGFLAPKLHGKSTTSLALVQAGARLITDDILVVNPGSQPMAYPGVHVTRLWGDSASRLLDKPSASPASPATERPQEREARLGARACPERSEGESFRAPPAPKHEVTDLPDARRMLDPTPLAALYLLAPMPDSADRAPAARTRLDPMHGALSLVAHSKLSTLLGGGEGATVLSRAADIARTVPVYRLDIVRDFARLDAVVGQIGEWHGGLP